MQCRLIVNDPGSGAWNMAVDESLLESASRRGTAALRLYGWREPTLSLGYFQRYAERHAHQASRGCAVVRRPSGGGAILHDREITYCLALPAGSALRRDPRTAYRAIHQAAAAALAHWRLETVPASRLPPPIAPPPFLCFLRYTEDDLIVALQAGQGRTAASRPGFKILGSAQRRRHGAVMQHGSLILARSDYAPEIPGLSEALGRPIDAAEFRAAWVAEIRASLGFALCPDELTADEWQAAEELASSKYGTVQWTERK
jgi:lipoate-protein ligase A